MNVRDLAGNVTIEFECLIKGAQTMGHQGSILHAGKFNLRVSTLPDIVGSPDFHRISVFIGTDGRQKVTLDGVTLSEESRGESLGALADDWKGELRGEVTPRGVILLGAHHAYGSGTGDCMYARTMGEVRNFSVYTSP